MEGWTFSLLNVVTIVHLSNRLPIVILKARKSLKNPCFKTKGMDSSASARDMTMESGSFSSNRLSMAEMSLRKTLTS
jgi:hypothetical protein